MTYREQLQTWVWEALDKLGGRGSVIDVAKRIWSDHETDLKAYGDHYYSWQYDMRWAAQQLREKGKLGFRKAGRLNEWFIR
ncbi:hypothetical protein [Sphingopyxis kveilinensis]|uniref:hypothetical protein n=1 Tax=Sphingopyxis kveilinensis TaxID=3114367 RepID=UPI0030CB8993